jgi:Rha family phage regulatory protein
VVMCATAPLATIKDGQVFANSRDVAEFFGKEHFNVLRDIRNLEMPSDLKASFFQPDLRPDNHGREVNTYDMTRDGFTLLAMGFTGKVAARLRPLGYTHTGTSVPGSEPVR